MKGRKVFIRAVITAATTATIAAGTAAINCPMFRFCSPITVMAAEAEAEAETEMLETAEIIAITEVSAQEGDAVSEEGVLGSYHETEEKRQKMEEIQTQAAAVRPYTDEDLYILAHVICGEAQGYSDEEQRYVGSVVLNRVNYPGRFPDTIKGVVFQRGQYSCTRDGNYYREPTKANWDNARWLLENGSILPGNVIYQSGGKQGSGVYLRTKEHYYCYD